MIGIELEVKQKEGISPAYAEAFGKWTLYTPFTEDEYKRFCEELDKAKETAEQIYLQTNGLRRSYDSTRADRQA